LALGALAAVIVGSRRTTLESSDDVQSRPARPVTPSGTVTDSL